VLLLASIDKEIVFNYSCEKDVAIILYELLCAFLSNIENNYATVDGKGEDLKIITK